MANFHFFSFPPFLKVLIGETNQGMNQAQS
jgi:hypothetical protein